MSDNTYISSTLIATESEMEHSLIHSVQKSFDTGYMPLTDFRSQMMKLSTPHYTSKFSFSSLIEELKGKSIAFRDSTFNGLISRLESIEADCQQDPQNWDSMIQLEDVNSLMLQLFSSFFFKDQIGFIKGPFENHRFRFQTDTFQNLLNEDRWEIKISSKKFMNASAQNVLMAGTVVLNTFYDQKVDFFAGEGMTLRDRETKMEKHYKFDIQLEYLKVKAVKPLKSLSERQIHKLYNNLYDKQLWLKYIPPENFIFEGFVVGFLNDVTKAEILSTAKEMAANEGGKSNHEEELRYMEILTRSYLDMPDLQFGVLQTIYGPWIESLTWCLLRRYEASLIQPSLEDPQSAYGKVMQDGKPVIVEDLRNKKYLSPLEKAIMASGIRSLLLAPLFNNEGKITSIFELASHEPYRLSQLTLLQLEEFMSLLEIGSNKFIQEMDNSVRLTIQQEFTSIHPSVEWKFRKVASNYFWERVIEERQSTPDDIVFEDVYPLYGQADIVSSSKQRNYSIQTDMEDNLERLYKVLISCRETVHFHLLDIFAEQVKEHLQRLEKGAFVSSDESIIVELLTEQIHPVLRKLIDRFPQLPKELLNEYFSYLDPELDIVYRSRKGYEESVRLINQTISHYLIQEEEKMQQILPHYFEKFQTDGVEYNIYLGQAILEEGEFHSFFLKDFRLWQLILMCDITRLVEEHAKSFPVHLTTAQLIFVYNNSLSIRFKMDEKQFDVDGAYNVRYEILKKRIDKAYIKGTNERLTQAGKIAIVWLQEKDRVEYQEYLDHLVKNGYIDNNIEDLELERMQGVEGLKAVRVTVK